MLFIIFGTRGVTSTANSGLFSCPSCRLDRDYAHKIVRRFFTLYFIPLIPLDKVGEYVECATCSGTFKTEVLDWDPRKEQRSVEAEFEKAIRHVMIRMMLADGDVDPAEVMTIQEVFEKLTGKASTEEVIRSEAERVVGEQQSLTEVVADIAPMLNDHGKEMVVRAAALVAGADGKLEPEELALLRAIGASLGLQKSRVQALLEPLRQGLMEADVA